MTNIENYFSRVFFWSLNDCNAIIARKLENYRVFGKIYLVLDTTIIGFLLHS